MDVVGSEIGQKMRSAIKAKLTELGCYVDDELPDYVMVMVANKRTRAQMEDDLQLFLGDNTVQFVNWLHQVLRKLQEVTVTAPAAVNKPENPEKTKVRSTSKEKKNKDKKEKCKEKHKKSDSKKSKKKSKEKSKEKDQKKEKKSHHKKKKSKDKQEAEVINRPNVPPLLMNMEKESEPSITDVFAGQILKNHGITIDTPKVESKIDRKPSVSELKRPMLPIIDPETISSDPSQTEASNEKADQAESVAEETRISVSSVVPRDEQMREINEIESKIQGLRQKLAEQLDSMSDDDEDFLNIRTEAEELMTDLAEDVFQEISAAKPASTDTPPIDPGSEKPPQSPPKEAEPTPQHLEEPEILPHIELNLPKRPIRERLGTREEPKKSTEPKWVEKKSEPKKVEKDRRESPDRFTPEREPDFWGNASKSRLGDQVEPQKKERVKKSSFSEDSSPEKPELSSKRMTSKVSVLESRSPRPRAGPASVVRVRPRPRPGPAPLLLRAVAEAHRSLLNIPPKKEADAPKIQRALVLPMRRGVEASKIVIQVAHDRTDRRNPSVSPAREASDCEIDFDTESLADLESDNDNKSSKESANSTKNGSGYVPTPITKKILNTNYVPPRPSERTYNVDESLVVRTINNHKTATEKEKGPTFVVTLDGLDPNIFLAKKLKTEGLIDDETEINKKIEEKPKKDAEKQQEKDPIPEKISSSSLEKKRLSDTSEESDTQVIIKATDAVNASETKIIEKRKSMDVAPIVKEESSPPVKKKRASPIVFDVAQKERDKIREKETDRVRERTESAGSDNHVTVTTNSSSNKYETVPALSIAERKSLPCRAFPLCRFGAACAFAHPVCKFATGCTRRNCVYSHPPATAQAKIPPVVASHVVPAANFKTISPTVVPNLCKYYPNCANPSCHFYHPKPCRYGKTCTNKQECNFYHHELQPSNKWRIAQQRRQKNALCTQSNPLLQDDPSLQLQNKSTEEYKARESKRSVRRP